MLSIADLDEHPAFLFFSSFCHFVLLLHQLGICKLRFIILDVVKVLAVFLQLDVRHCIKGICRH